MKTLADDIIETEPRIDYLIFNSGVMALPQLILTEHGFEMQIATNHIGHHYLFSLLEPMLLSQSCPCRIITLSSCAHSVRLIYMFFCFLILFLVPYLFHRHTFAFTFLYTTTILIKNGINLLLQWGDIDVNDINFTKGRPYEALTAYGQSKTANLLFAKSLADRFKYRPAGREIISLSVHPGVIKTNLGRYMGKVQSEHILLAFI